MAVRAVTDVNDDTFGEEVLKNTAPVLVDFWAPWCGPCRMIMPLIDELSVEFSGKLKCVKLNTDESPNVATDYGRRLGDNAIGPTLLSSSAWGAREAIHGDPMGPLILEAMRPLSVYSTSILGLHRHQIRQEEDDSANDGWTKMNGSDSPHASSMQASGASPP